MTDIYTWYRKASNMCIETNSYREIHLFRTIHVERGRVNVTYSAETKEEDIVILRKVEFASEITEGRGVEKKVLADYGYNMGAYDSNDSDFDMLIEKKTLMIIMNW